MRDSETESIGPEPSSCDDWQLLDKAEIVSAPGRPSLWSGGGGGGSCWTVLEDYEDRGDTPCCSAAKGMAKTAWDDLGVERRSTGSKKEGGLTTKKGPIASESQRSGSRISLSVWHCHLWASYATTVIHQGLNRNIDYFIIDCAFVYEGPSPIVIK